MAEVFASSLFAPEGEGYQFFDVPNANYGSSSFDSVVDAGGNVVGLSMFTGYSANEKHCLSLATLDRGIEHGTELQVIWGEPDGGSDKATVQPHRQKAVRVIVSPVPYAKVVRQEYADGWRTVGKAG
jgi:vanillate/3-O-methylgallate O-demethylase